MPTEADGSLLMPKASSKASTIFDEHTQVQVRFHSKRSQYAVIENIIAVPAKLQRYGFSEVINHLLGNAKPIPFDFLIDGEFLRTSLAQFMEARSISPESVVDMDYIPSILPPEIGSTIPHKDWVSSIDGHREGLILTGSYDQHVRVWTHKGVCLNDLAVHKAAVKCVSWCYPREGYLYAISGALDSSLRAHRIILESDKSKGNLGVATVEYQGHSGSVESIAINPSQSLCVSGSWDRTLRLWSVSSLFDSEEDSSFNDDSNYSNDLSIHRKVNNQTSTNHRNTKSVQTPIAVMEAHSQPVTCVVFPSAEVIYSGGQDQCIRVWDTAMTSLTRTLTCDKAVLSLSSLGATIASGHSDNIVRVWDVRTSEGPMVRLKLKGHLGWVSSLCWLTTPYSSTSSSLLLSGSYDGTLRLWDLRGSTTPLYTLKSHEDKILDVASIVNPDQPSQLFLLSGGADNMLRIHSMIPPF